MKRFFTLTVALLSILIWNAAAQTAASRTQPLTQGFIAPDFSLIDASGKRVTLSSIKQPTVLVFYRGYW